jgi:hypothetical protein
LDNSGIGPARPLARTFPQLAVGNGWQGVKLEWRTLNKLLGVLLVPAGLAAFMLYLQWSLGDALAFLDAQSAWQRELVPPYETVFRAAAMAIAGEPDATRHAMGILNTGATLLFFGICAWSLGRLPASYVIFALAYLVVPLSSPVPDMPTVSMARFTAVLFPAFFAMALWGRRGRVHDLIVAGSVALFTLLTALFVNWYWVV